MLKMPPTAILSIYLHKPIAGPHCRTGFPRGVPRLFLEFSLCRSTGKCKRKSSSLLELRTSLRFRLYKRKIGPLIQTIHDEKAKGDQKTLCTGHRISGYEVATCPSKIGEAVVHWCVGVFPFLPHLRYSQTRRKSRLG